MKAIFKGTSIDKCIDDACELFNIEKHDLKYNILEEKKILFKKKFVLEVTIPDNEKENKKNEVTSECKKIDEEVKNEEEDTVKYIEESVKLNEKQGTVKVKDGKIIVKNPQEDGDFAKIIVDKSIMLTLNGENVNGQVQVTENDKLKVDFEKVPPTRHLDISVSEEKMEAYISINYTPGNEYILKDCEEKNIVLLEKKVFMQKYSPKYTIEEIEQELSKLGIVYGIIKENIENCVENDCTNVLIAKGDEAVDGQDDILEYKFPIDEKFKKLVEDETGRVDFKSIGSVKAVKIGDIIAIKRNGNSGINGKDVKGKVKKAKPGKKIKIRVGQGCKLEDSNTVVATIYGKPCVKNNTFYVYKVHEVRSDVDLNTGNIKFIGDIIIHGSVKEGMEVTAGNSIVILKDVERSTIQATGDINIDGNIIAANIIGGGEDVNRLKLLENLTNLKNDIVELINTVEEIKKFNLLGDDKRDGEIIKVLIENKFKSLPKTCLKIITGITLIGDTNADKTIVPIIKQKLVGLGPITIKHYSELSKILDVLEYEIILLKGELALPVNLKMNYCQDSKINSSGDIIVAGKGEYISDIIANGGVYFLDEKGVARGGLIKAKKEIKCKTVGSIGGVCTKLMVEESGHIWAEVAYPNTMFVLGQREFLLEVPSKNIHAYIDNKGELIVDRLLL
ncbi:DUF342 domain-containing protein [Clostridium rectalis]|uniref:DUF342 domain-containing protein n=1 Tax=Clostridium rectalis TaxID=2040295 RepID=UPI001FAB18DA|nr:flagellar assembly protein A [Clostridium rectalis]